MSDQLTRQRVHVALLIETSNAYARGLLHGIRDYARESPNWTTSLGEQSRGAPPPSWLKDWRGDGIIARVENARIAEAIQATKVPVIDVSAAQLLSSAPCVETDDEEIAWLAAGHFIERGLKHFAFCANYGFNWSTWRCEHFVRFIQEAGFDCSVFQPRPSRGVPDPWKQNPRRLADWIRELPKPVGVMAAWDGCGLHVVNACHHLGLAIPDEVAVLGVDNDELICDIVQPSLTSIKTNPVRTGRLAAELLDKLMRGEPVEWKIYRVKPETVIARQSTDSMAISDPDVVLAMQFIRRHACEGIHVEDVLRVVSLGRRTLESRFRKLLGRTPHEEIVRIQTQRVKELLTATDLPLREIAQRAGFNHVEYLSRAFKKQTGVPPSVYRKQSRRSDS